MRFRLNDRTVIINDTSDKTLFKHGWYRSAEYYKYDFTLHKYKKQPIILCTFILDKNERIFRINVMSGDDIYSPYYYREFGTYGKLLKNIDKKIKNKMKELGIKYEESSKFSES